MVRHIRFLVPLTLAVLLAACGGAAVNVGGTWSGTATCDTGCTGEFPPLTMNLVQSGSVVTGTINGGIISSGTASGNAVTLVTDEAFEVGGNAATFTFTGTVQGDAMSGNFSYTTVAGNGGGTFTATR